MAIVDLQISVTALSTVIQFFDKLRVYRSTSGSSGPYIQITTPANSIQLTAHTAIYEFVDANGDPSYYYKTSYYSSSKGVESSLSDAFQGAGDPALGLLSVAEFKATYFQGIDLTDTTGTPFPDAMFEFYIKSGVTYMADSLDLCLRPTVILDEKHDYYQAEQREYMWTKLYQVPVQSVQQFRLQFPGSAPIIMPDDYVDVQLNTGVVQIIPATTSGFGYNISPLPIGQMGGYSSYASRSRIPSAIRVDYTAGFAAGQCPADIKDVIGMASSYGIFALAGDLIGGAGIASSSLSIDGLSSSASTTSSPENSGYSGRTKFYERILQERIPILRRKYRGIPLTII